MAYAKPTQFRVPTIPMTRGFMEDFIDYGMPVLAANGMPVREGLRKVKYERGTPGQPGWGKINCALWLHYMPNEYKALADKACHDAGAVLRRVCYPADRETLKRFLDELQIRLRMALREIEFEAIHDEDHGKGRS